MKIIAHRGANKRAPQNTISAFKIAKEMNPDGFETDVHLTKDGRVVICHNPDVDKTSDGKGFINDMTYDELRSLDFGSYFSGEHANERIPEISEFLEVAKGIEIINIEIKTPHNHDYSVVDKTIASVKDFGLEDNLLISSFDPVVLRRVKDIDSDVKTALLYDFTKKVYRDIAKDPVGYADNLGCSAIHPFKMLIDYITVKKAHKKGMTVNCWTIDDKLSAERLALIGADGLITDIPDIMQSYRAR